MVGRNPVRDHIPLRTIPLLKANLATALVIVTLHRKGRQNAGGTQFLDPFSCQIEVLHAPAVLLSTKCYVAEFSLRVAQGLHGHNRACHAAVVVHAAHAGSRKVALHVAVDVFENILDYREIRTGRMEGRRDVALGRLAGGNDIFL